MTTNYGLPEYKNFNQLTPFQQCVAERLNATLGNRMTAASNNPTITPKWVADSALTRRDVMLAMFGIKQIITTLKNSDDEELSNIVSTCKQYTAKGRAYLP